MSPIRGLTENRRLIRQGKIHLGLKVQKVDPKTKEPVYNDRGEPIMYPRATDYFVCPDEVRAIYGKEPKRLDIIIPVEDDEMWCSQYYRAYSRTRGLICRGDGQTCRRMIDRHTGAMADRDTKEVAWEEMTCEGRACADYQAKRCQEVMNLQFLLPRVPGLGVWQIDTGSINSIRNINDNASMLRAVCERVSWIPLTLTLEPKEVVNPDDGKKKVVRCLNIRHERGLLEILEASGKPRVALLIPSPAEDQEPLDELAETDEPSPESQATRQEPIRPKVPPVVEPPLKGAKTAQGVIADLTMTTVKPDIFVLAPREDWDAVTPATVPTFPQLEALFHRLTNLQPSALYKELGVKNRTEMVGTKPWDAFITLKEIYHPALLDDSDELGDPPLDDFDKTFGEGA